MMDKKIIIPLAILSCNALFCKSKKEIPVVTPEPILVLGKLDDPHEAFHKPKDVETDSNGNIYIG